MRRSECNDTSSHTKVAGEKENSYGASCKDAVHAHLLGFPRYTKKIFLATFQRAEITLEYACFLRRENVRMLDA